MEKFHDYDMVVTRQGHEVYALTGLPAGSRCIISRDLHRPELWQRMTKNRGMNGSIRYESYTSLDAALSSGIVWARRKDRELARCPLCKAGERHLSCGR